MAISHSGLKTGDSAAGGDAAKSGLLSRSKCLRERGNTLYREATSQTSLPSIRSARLQDAIQLYCQALSLSQSDNDRAMCCKNLGQAFWARAKLNLEARSHRSSDRLVDSLCFDLLSSVSYFLEALRFSRPATQPKEWVQGIQWTLVDVAWTVDDDMRFKGKFLWELCAVFQQKIPRNNVKLQASAIVHKACAQEGLKNAINLGEGPGLEKIALLEEALLHLSVAESHTDSSATAFLLEIGALRDTIKKRIEQQQRRDSASPRMNQDHSQNQNRNRNHQNEAHRNPQQPQLRRNQTYSEERSHATQSRISADSRPPGLAGKGGSFRVPRNWSGSQPSDLERMFTSLCPFDFLQRLYEKYPPPGGRKESLEFGARDIRDLKSAYKRAISLYHPDHDRGLKQHGKLADDITKYLIINFNSLKGE